MTAVGGRGPAAAVPSGPSSSIEPGGFTQSWSAVSLRTSPWTRIRSGFVLTVLLFLLGTLVAAGVAGFVVLLALAIRSAVG